jgi:hypothetical protein
LFGDFGISSGFWGICAVIGFHLGYDLHIDKRELRPKPIIRALFCEARHAVFVKQLAGARREG